MSRLFLISADELDASLTAFGRDRGSGTVLPAADLRRGDVYFHTGLGCLMAYTGTAWRQTHSPSVADAAALTALSTAYSGILYDGFTASVLDVDAEARWNGTQWDGLWTAYTPTFSATTTAPTLGTGGTITGRYRKTGRAVDVQVYLAFGTGGTVGSGSWTLSLPVAAAAGREQQLNLKMWGSLGNAAGVAYFSGGSLANLLAIASATSAILNPLPGSHGFSSGNNVSMYGRYESAT